MQDKKYYLGFSLCNGIGVKRFTALIKYFETAKKAWDASEKDLGLVLGKVLASQFVMFRQEFDPKNYAQKLKEKNVLVFIPQDAQYPPLLKKIENQPFVIYVLGDASVLLLPKTMGVVGSRKITPYGRQVTTMLTKQLVEQDFVIVSGLAIGVDTTAHTTAVTHNGKTIAVLGGGVDICVPSNNRSLYDIIYKKSGCIVSTFPLGQSSFKGLFPARNSTIAGLSLGILVTEGTADSGALITAQKAKEYKRPVFAVPGPITSGLSCGTNNLIKQGAIAVSCCEEIIKYLGYKQKVILNAKKINNYSPDEQKIVHLLQNEPLHFDQIVVKMGQDAKTIGIILGLMEVKEIIKQQGGLYIL